MRLLAALALLLAGCNSCQPAPPPPPPPPPPPVVTPTPDQAVYNELVEAGCFQASEGGLQAVIQDNAAGDHAWLGCLYDGGTIQACAVPCK